VPLFSPLQFKVVTAIENLPTYTRSTTTAQEVLGSSALIFDVAPASAAGSDLSQFLVAAWVRHPDLIPNEVGGIVLEPVELFVDHAQPLFVSSSKPVHSSATRCNFMFSFVFWRCMTTQSRRTPMTTPPSPTTTPAAMASPDRRRASVLLSAPGQRSIGSPAIGFRRPVSHGRCCPATVEPASTSGGLSELQGHPVGTN
jgi:hypothetical protein